MALLSRCSGSVVTTTCAILMASGASCSTMDPASDVPESVELQTLVQIKTLSNRADLVSGGDVLVEAVLHQGLAFRSLSLTVNGLDVTSSFAVRADGRITGLITGLAEGPNRVIARLNGRPAAGLTITNHKIGGPVFSGAQVTPFVCATPLARPQQGDVPGSNASGLSTEAFDAQCNIATEVKLFYRSSNPACANVVPDPNPPAVPNPNACFKLYNAASPPADLAMTTTDTGVTVPYIVRVERGTLNRDRQQRRDRLEPDRAAAGLEPQGRLLVRRVDRPAAPAVSLGAELGGPQRALARIPGRHQQHDGLALQLQPDLDDRDRDDDEGEDHRQLRRSPLCDRQWLLGRLDQPADRGLDLSRSRRRHPADLHLSRLGVHGHRGQ